jgi:N-acetyl-D-muramate 6-phosphate phosphatase
VNSKPSKNPAPAPFDGKDRGKRSEVPGDDQSGPFSFEPLSPPPLPQGARGSVKPSIKAVLFDLDGTFADTAPDLAAALNYTRATRHLPPLPLSEIRPQASHGTRGLFKAGFSIGPEHPDYSALREIFLDYYERNICVHTRLFGDTAALVEELEGRGMPWGIVTNKPHRFTLPLMQALGYAERAACLISGDTCARAKPHPDPLLKASEIMGALAANCLYLGDDLRDMQAANAAGMRGIIASYGYVSDDASVENWHAQGSIDSPCGLLQYLE